MRLTAASRVGPYKVLGYIGAGAMGEVYRARDTRLPREVALKVLFTADRLDARRLARFDREAKILASLSHLNIATLFDVLDTDGVQALAMEFVEGQSLRDHLSRPDRRAGIPVTEALAIVRQIAEAVETAHAHGVIHRDLKPANVMLRPDGVVKVLDFGLATIAPTADADEAVSSTVTETGLALGTPAYMSPEQARGAIVDRRTDIWSWGCILFELVTGRRAFDGPTSADVLAAVLEREPSWDALPSGAPAGLRRLLSRCLAKDPRRRLHDMGDVLIELEDLELVEGKETQATVRHTRSLRTWRAAAFGGLAAFGVLLGWTLGRPEPSPEARRFELAFSPEAPLTIVGGVSFGGHVAVSPDGARIVYPTQRGLAVRLRNQMDVTVLDLPGENPNSPFFSPDGLWIGYSTADSTLRKVSVTGGPSVLVGQAGNAAIGTWGERGIVFASQQGLFRVDADLEDPVRVPLDLAQEEQATAPDVLPGGRVALVTVLASRTNTPGGIATDPTSRIDAVDLATGARKTVIRGGGRPRYLPTGHLAFGSGNSLRVIAFDAATQEIRGTPVDVLSDQGSSQFAFSRDGSLVYIRAVANDAVGTLVWVDREGRETSLGAPTMRYIYPRLSPDGRRVALDVGGANRDIYVWDIERRVMQRFTTDRAEDAIPRWTPDGTKLAFANSRYGIPNIFWQASDGSGTPERVFESPMLQQPLAFSPDGDLVVSEVAPGRGRGLKVISLGQPRRLRTLIDNAANPELSPDGRWMAYGSTRSGQFEVYVTEYPSPRSHWQVSNGGGRHAAWSRDGRELFYRDFDGALMVVPVRLSPTFAAGAPRRLFQNPSYRGAGRGLSDRTYDVTPDGQRFLMIRSEPSPPPTIAVVENWFDELRRKMAQD